MSFHSNRVLQVFGVALLVLAVSALPAAAADDFMVVFEAKKLEPGEAAKIVESLGGTVIEDYHEIGVAMVHSDEPNFQARLAAVKGVLGVQADEVRQATFNRTLNQAHQEAKILGISGPPANSLSQTLAREDASGLENVSGNGVDVDPTTLPFWPFQWNLQIMGMEDVYDAGKFGSPDVTVSILGTGVDYRHPDLEGKVNLTLSRSFVAEEDALVQNLFPGAHPVADLQFEGTFYASQLTCNLTFLACVAPNIELVGVKVLDKDTMGTPADLVAGILYAAEFSDVIVFPFSLWGPGQGAGGPVYNIFDAEDRADIFAVRRAIFQAKRRGAMVITQTSTPFFQFAINADELPMGEVIIPADNGAFTVGASGSQDQWSEISNYGSLVNMVAPGGWADPTIPPDPLPFSPESEFIWGACSSFSQFGRLKDECAFENQPQFIIVLGAGNSAAYVAGVAALVDSEFGGRLNGNRLQNILLRTATDIEAPGRDPFTGRGRLDAADALGL